MGYYVGLDVSLESRRASVFWTGVDLHVVWRGVSDTQIAMLAEHLAAVGQADCACRA